MTRADAIVCFMTQYNTLTCSDLIKHRRATKRLMGNTNSQKMPVMSLQDYYSELEMKPVTVPGPWVRIEITIVRPQIKPTLLPASTQAKLMIHGCIKVICK